MSGSSVTVATLAVQLLRIKDSQDELRTLLMDVLGEMLKVSQVQAESNLKFLTLIEQQGTYFQALTNVGPGTSRTVTETDEYVAWRREIDDVAERAQTHGL